jgi:YVTN family beta-propeller protein
VEADVKEEIEERGVEERVARRVAQTMVVAYVTNYGSNSEDNEGTVSVIDTATNQVTATVLLSEIQPFAMAITPDGTKVYVTDESGGAVSVINTTTNNVAAPIPVGNDPYWAVVTPDGTKVYVTNAGSGTVSVIDTATNQVTANVPVGTGGFCSAAVTPDGTQVYVVNDFTSGGTISVIDTATNQVTATVSVGYDPGCVVFATIPAIPTSDGNNCAVSMAATITSVLFLFLTIGNAEGNTIAIGIKKKTRVEAMATDQELTTTLWNSLCLCNEFADRTTISMGEISLP